MVPAVQVLWTAASAWRCPPVHLVVDEEVDLAHVLDLDLDTRRSGTIHGSMTDRGSRPQGGGGQMSIYTGQYD